MNDAFTINDLHRLICEQSEPCVSLYLPTLRIGGEALQNTIQLKNLLVDAEQRMLPFMKQHSAVQQLMRPIGELLQDGRLWADISAGMAIFRSTNFLQYWRLPVAFESLAFVGKRFFIKPLLPLATHDDRFYVLAVSQNAAKLFEGSHEEFTELHPANLPKGLAEALHLHQPEKLFQVRSVSTAIHGKEGAILHGQRAITEHAKDDILAYFRSIEGALHAFLKGKHAPLLFAGVGYLFPIYGRANTYPHFIDQPITGNWDYTNPAELHQRAVETLSPYWHRDEKQDLDRLERAAGTERASSKLRDILSAAYQGRIEALFVASDVEPWGRFDPDTGHFELTASQAEGSEGLLDAAAYATLKAGGRVHCVKSTELPLGKLANAPLRYSLAVTPA